MSDGHVDKWNGLSRHHNLPKTIDEFIEMYRPKEIRSYEENGNMVRVFEPVLILRDKK